MLFRARITLAQLKLLPTRRHFCAKPTNNTSPDKSIESNVTKYDEAYQQLDKLDFMTASKILFTSDPPKNKKFGIDFHLVQLFFACLPSLAVYLVAQYARHERRKFDAELERKRKEEEDKAKEIEEMAHKEKEAEAAELSDVKVRLNKLEETLKEIVVESKKQPGGAVMKNQEDGEKRSLHHVSTSIKSESGKSMDKDQFSKQKAVEIAPGLDKDKVTGSTPSNASQQRSEK